MTKQVLGVGHCGYDNSRLQSVLKKLGGSYENIDSPAAALEKVKQGDYALVLPNRVIGGDQTGGLGVIKAMQKDETLRATPVLLISAMRDKQEEAVAAGARPGFGKDLLESAEVAELLSSYLS